MTDANEQKQSPIWVKLWPIYLIAAVMIGAWQLGLFQYLSLDTLREQQEVLQGFVANNLVLAIAIFIAVYAAATLFTVPGALWITIAGGFLFGLVGGSLATITGATLGASLLFFAAKTSIGSALRDRAGPFMAKMEAGFNENPFSIHVCLETSTGRTIPGCQHCAGIARRQVSRICDHHGRWHHSGRDCLYLGRIWPRRVICGW